MGRNLKLGVLALLTCVCCAAVAWAQATPSLDAKSADPLNALWSLLGSSGAAGVLWLWAKSEREERRETSKAMVGLFEADATHKAAIRERLKGQDDMLAKVLAEVQQLRQQLLRSPPPGGGG